MTLDQQPQKARSLFAQLGQAILTAWTTVVVGLLVLGLGGAILVEIYDDHQRSKAKTHIVPVHPQNFDALLAQPDLRHLTKEERRLLVRYMYSPVNQQRLEGNNVGEAIAVMRQLEAGDSQRQGPAR